MHKQWLILFVLTLARVTIGFQFQSIAAVGTNLTTETAISYTALGTLMGVYLLPGAFFSIPCGKLGKRFGDKRVVLIGLAAMSFGGVLMALSVVYEVMFIGRVISGIGAVLLNVLVSKMVTDWFGSDRVVIAMGILVSSWPLGIAIALLILGPITDVIGLQWTFMIPVAMCVLAYLLVAVVYVNPEQELQVDEVEPIKNSTRGLSSMELKGVVLGGMVWCFYNVALILPLSFGPEFLSTKGVGPLAAGAIVSLTSWMIIPALPLGGWFAQHIGRPMTVMIVNFILIGIVIMIIPFTSSYTIIFAFLGLIFGPAGGLIMALPRRILRAENRAVGMGIFFTVYYVGMGVFPSIAGYFRDVSANPDSPFWIASLMIVFAMLALLGLARLVLRKIENELE